MEPEEEFDFIELIKIFNERKYRYLLIGRQAVLQFGAPLMTIDYDLWIQPKDKKKVLSFLINEKGFEGPSPDNWDKPMITVYAGIEKLDLLFLQRIENREGQLLDFNRCFERAIIKEDPKIDFFIRLPSIDDLIALKKVKNKSAKDEEDLKYLLLIKKRKGK